MTLDDYILDHISPEHPYLYRLYRATNTTLLRPRMASGHLQGQLLKMLCQMMQPQRVLEIGTYSGYSALSMASGMPEGSHLYTFEINDEQEDFTRPWIEGSPWADRITMIIGDVTQLLPQLIKSIESIEKLESLEKLENLEPLEKLEKLENLEPLEKLEKLENLEPLEKLEKLEKLESLEKQLFDFVFMDANKRDYCDYYHLVMPYLRTGGCIIADNTLWDGHVVDPAYARDAQTRGILAFNDLMRQEAEDGKIELCLLPIRDGLTLIRKN